MILGLGTVLVDQQMLLSGFPAPDTKNEVVSHRLQVGGPVPTALALLSRWGHDCEFIGNWADDVWGHYIETDLQREGLGVSFSPAPSPGVTGLAHVWIDNTNGQRTVAFTRGTCGEIPLASVQACDVSACDILHLDGWSAETGRVLAERVKQAGGTVVMDCGSPKPGIDQLLPFVDFVNCPRRFAEQFFGDADLDRAASRLLSMGPSRVVFTHGEEGAVLYGDGIRLQQESFDVEAADTNGAGDVFCGALIHGILNRWENTQLLRFAAATAALKCTGIGNRQALPQLKAVDQMVSGQDAGSD